MSDVANESYRILCFFLKKDKELSYTVKNSLLWNILTLYTLTSTSTHEKRLSLNLLLKIIVRDKNMAWIK